MRVEKYQPHQNRRERKTLLPLVEFGQVCRQKNIQQPKNGQTKRKEKTTWQSLQGQKHQTTQKQTTAEAHGDLLVALTDIPKTAELLIWVSMRVESRCLVSQIHFRCRAEWVAKSLGCQKKWCQGCLYECISPKKIYLSIPYVEGCTWPGIHYIYQLITKSLSPFLGPGLQPILGDLCVVEVVLVGKRVQLVECCGHFWLRNRLPMGLRR